MPYTQPISTITQDATFYIVQDQGTAVIRVRKDNQRIQFPSGFQVG